ncbi:MAG TPA: YjbH domain-containing protein, partial [Paracoccaceae bacterium]|nr:YjbH domain-containing protein [Paracoccaceae bacterium]
MRLSSLAIFMISTCGFAQPFYAQDISFGMEGTAGLIDMPDASVLPDGETAFTYSAMGETTRYNFAFQLLPRLESAVHYSSIGAWDADGLFDASVDLKYQLLDEKGLRPAVAIGSRDFLSNGVYSSEYLVASKTVADDFTVTGGVGWGRLGTANSVGQLLSERPPQDSTGLDFDHFFKGDMGLFGGIAWRTPVNGLTVKAEYSSDAYTQEQAHGGFSPLSQFNFGAEYAPVNGVSLGAYYNYGTDLGFRVTFHGNPNRPIVSPDLGLGPVPIKPRAAGYSTNASWAANPIATTALAGGLAPVLAAEGIVLEEMLITGTTIDLYVTNSNMPMTTKAIGRIARSLTLALPPSVEVFRITPVSGDLATVTVEIKRSDMEAQAETPDAAPRSWQTTRLLDAENHLTAANAWQRERDSNFEWGIAPNVPISLDSGSLGFDVLLAGTASLRLGQGMSINGAVSQKIFGSAATDAE